MHWKHTEHTMKKGNWLIDNLGGIVLAVIGIGLLLLVVVKFADLSINEESEKAKNILNNVIGKMENLEGGETGSFAIQGLDNWYLTGWNTDEGLERCYLNNCICICKGGGGIDECQSKKSFCQNVDNDIEVYTEDFKPSLENPNTREGSSLFHSILARDCIPLRSKLQEIKISSQQGNSSITFTNSPEDFDLNFKTCNPRLNEPEPYNDPLLGLHDQGIPLN